MYDFEEREERPKILTGKNIGYAVLAHILLFLSFYLFAIPFKSRPVIIPIDLTVVVNENLDGEENEPPPEKPVEPLPPPPPPEPPKPVVKPPDPPKVEEKLEAVEQIVEKKKPKEEKKKVEEKKPEKPKEPEKPKPPEKTKEQLMQERIERMRNSAKDVKTPPKKKVDPPKNNGKTDKRPQDWEKLLNQGYKPGATTNLAASEEQLCLSLIKQRFESKWDKPAWTDTLKPMVIRCKFGPGGKLIAYNITQSSGDRAADQSILRAASLVGSVPGLTQSFIDKYKGGIDIRFTVTPQ